MDEHRQDIRESYNEGKIDGVLSCAAGPWRPIEEAPKDGTVILLSNERIIARAGRWDADLSWKSVTGYCIVNPTHWASINPPKDNP